MSDKLQILIQAVLDEKLSVVNLNNQLKSLKTNNIEITAKINTSDVKKQLLDIKKNIFDVSSGGSSIDLNRLSAYYSRIEKQSESFASKSKAAFTSIPIKEYLNNLTKTSDVQKKMSAYYKQLEKDASSFVKVEQQRDTLLNRGQSFFNTNSVAAKKYATEWATVSEQIKSANNPETYQAANRSLQNLISTIKSNGDLGKTFFGGMAEEAEKFAKWTLASGSVMLLANSVRQIVTSVTELDTVLTDLRMATGYSADETENLLDQYNTLGKRIGATTKEVAASASDWLRQGLSVAETNTMIENSMILSKVGLIDSAQATEYLTTAMKGYQVSVKDTLGIVDKLSAVDLISATSAGGLAEGMAEVATNARLAGVSMDRLIGYLAIIGETSGASMSSVGNSLSTIFSRMGNIKLSRLDDYELDGDLSNVETSLRKVGIELRSSTDTFRDFDDVLDEVASKWTTYDNVTQRAIASSIAGKEHAESFLILMSSYGKALEYTEVSMNSAGTATEKMGAYNESLEAKVKSSTSAFEGLSRTILDSSLLKFFVDLNTTGVSTLDEIIKKFGTLGTVASVGMGVLSAKGSGRITEIQHATGEFNGNVCELCAA